MAMGMDYANPNGVPEPEKIYLVHWQFSGLADVRRKWFLDLEKAKQFLYDEAEACLCMHEHQFTVIQTSWCELLIAMDKYDYSKNMGYVMSFNKENLRKEVK